MFNHNHSMFKHSHHRNSTLLSLLYIVVHHQHISFSHIIILDTNEKYSKIDY